MTPVTTTTVTAAGEATLGRALLDRIGARPGDRLRTVALPGGHLDIMVDAVADDLRDERRDASDDRDARPLEAFFGSLKHDGMPALTIEEMNDAIAQAVVDEFNGCD